MARHSIKNGAPKLGANTQPRDWNQAMLQSLDVLLEHVGELWEIFKKDVVDPERYEERGIRVSLSIPVLTEATMNAMADMTRMVAFHFPNGGGQGDQADNHKYAAYMSKWIAQFRPITFSVDDELHAPPALFQINAYFAVYVFESFLESLLPQETVESLIYTFHYREVSPQMLSILAFACEDAGKNRQKIEVLEQRVRLLKQKLKQSGSPR